MNRLTEVLAEDATASAVLAALVSGCLWSLSEQSPPASLFSFYNGGAALAAIVSAVLAISGIVLKPRRIERKDKSTEVLALIVGRLLRAIEASSPDACMKAKEELALIADYNWNNPQFKRMAECMLSAARSQNDMNEKPVLPSQ